MVEVVNMRTCDPPWGQPGDVRIDRKTKWGNPHHIEGPDNSMSKTTSIEKYRSWVATEIARGNLNITDLAGAKRLGCWCKPKACHGDVLKNMLHGFQKNPQRKLS